MRIPVQRIGLATIGRLASIPCQISSKRDTLFQSQPFEMAVPEPEVAGARYE